MSLRLLRRTRLAVMAAACWLAGCVAPPPEEAGELPAAATAGAPQQPASGTGLQPLPRELAVPAGSRPRSQVTAANYDLSVSSLPEYLPDDGLPGDAPLLEELERGGASWYGIQFHQKKTASGERFDMGNLTAAHKTLPFGSHVCVRSLVTGREVMVRINDRGPYATGRVIDLSRAAADAIGMLGLGIKPVSLAVVHKGQKCGSTLNENDDVDSSVMAAPATRKVAARPRRAVVQRRR